MDFELEDLEPGQKKKERIEEPVCCPFCGKALQYRLAHRRVLLYEGDDDELWGERDVLTFDYLRYKPGYLLDCFRSEWYREGDRIYEICDDVLEEAVAEYCAQSGLPKGVARKTFHDFEVTPGNMEAFNTCKEFAEEFPQQPGRGLAITGDVGVGKTHLAAATLVEIVRRGLGENRRHVLCFYSIPRLFQQIRWRTGGGELRELEALHTELIDADLVVLDDLGVTRPGEEELQQLFLFIDGRLTHERPIIITTNLRSSEIAVNVGERIADRLQEACKWLEISGRSYRQR